MTSIVRDPYSVNLNKPAGETRQSADAEQALLGGLLLDALAWSRIADKVIESDFQLQEHRLIFDAIRTLAVKGSAVDVLTVENELKSHNQLANAGGLAYLASLANNIPSAANITAWAELVAKAGRTRRLRSSLEHAISAIDSGRVDEAIAFVTEGKAERPSVRLPHVYLDDASVARNRDYVIKGFGPLILIYGPSGGGKTFFTIDMLGHAAARLPRWRGHRVSQTPGLFVYVAAEAGESILPRGTAWRNEKLGDAHEDRVPLVFLTRGANLLNADEVSGLMATLRDLIAESGLPLKMVALDTLSRSIAGGDENSAQDMTLAIAAADRIRDEFDAVIAFVHHSGKDQSKGARGHSALFAAADTVIAVADGVATIEKSRDGQSGQTYGFRLSVVDLGVDSDGDPLTTCVIEPSDVAPASKQRARLNATGKVALQALKETVADHGLASTGTSSIPSGVRTVNIDLWRNRFVLRYGNEKDAKPGATRMAFLRGKDALIKAGMVGISDPLVWLTE